MTAESHFKLQAQGCLHVLCACIFEFRSCDRPLVAKPVFGSLAGSNGVMYGLATILPELPNDTRFQVGDCREYSRLDTTFAESGRFDPIMSLLRFPERRAWTAILRFESGF